MAGSGHEEPYIFSIMDSSRVSTFFISILLIVYGSFRSLAMEDEESKSADDDDENDKKPGVQTLDSWQALCLPLGASISLLIMFFFFDSMQMLFAMCTAVIATVALAFLLLPMCQYFLRPCGRYNKISLGCCGKFTSAELTSFTISTLLVFTWVMTGMNLHSMYNIYVFYLLAYHLNTLLPLDYPVPVTPKILHIPSPISCPLNG